MEKEKKIKLTMKKLQDEMDQLLKQVNEKEKLLEEQWNLYRKLYPEFFDSKTNSEFILYNRFSGFKQIQAYYSENAQYNVGNHPVHEYGQFDIRWLTEVIKLLYS